MRRGDIKYPCGAFTTILSRNFPENIGPSEVVGQRNVRSTCRNKYSLSQCFPRALLFFSLICVKGTNSYRCWKDKILLPECPSGLSITYDTPNGNKLERGKPLQWDYTVRVPDSLVSRGNYIIKHGNTHACRKNPRIGDDQTNALNDRCNPFISDVRLLEVNTHAMQVDLKSDAGVNEDYYQGELSYTYSYTSIRNALKPGTYWAFSHVFFCSGMTGGNCTGMRYDVQSDLHKMQVLMNNDAVIWVLTAIAIFLAIFSIGFYYDSMFLVKLHRVCVKCFNGEGTSLWMEFEDNTIRNDTKNDEISKYQMRAKKLVEERRAIARTVKDLRKLERGDIVLITKVKEDRESAHYGQEAEVVNPVGWMVRDGESRAQIKCITGDHIGRLKSYAAKDLRILDKVSDQAIADLFDWSIAEKLHEADCWTIDKGDRVLVSTMKNERFEQQYEIGDITEIEWEKQDFMSGAYTAVKCTVQLNSGIERENVMPYDLGKLLYLSKCEYLNWWAEFRSREAQFYEVDETREFEEESFNWGNCDSDYLVNINFRKWWVEENGPYAFGALDPILYFESARVDLWDFKIFETHKQEWLSTPPSLKNDLKRRCFHLKLLMKDAGVLSYRVDMETKDEVLAAKQIKDAGLKTPSEIFVGGESSLWHNRFFMSAPKNAEELYDVFEYLSKKKGDEIEMHPSGSKVEVQRHHGVVRSVRKTKSGRFVYHIAFDDGFELKEVDERLVEDPNTWEQTRNYYFRLSKDQYVFALKIIGNGSVGEDKRMGKIVRVWANGLRVFYDIRFLRLGKQFSDEEDDEKWEDSLERIDSIVVERIDSPNDTKYERDLSVLRRLAPIVEVVIQIVNDATKEMKVPQSHIQECYDVYSKIPKQSSRGRRSSIVAAVPGLAYHDKQKLNDAAMRVDVTDEQADDVEKSDVVRMEMSRRAWDQRELLRPTACTDPTHPEHAYFSSAASEEQVELEIAVMLQDLDRKRDFPERNLIKKFELHLEYKAIANYLLAIMKQRRKIIRMMSKQFEGQRKPSHEITEARSRSSTTELFVKMGSVPQLQSRISFSGVGSDEEQTLLQLEPEVRRAYEILGAYQRPTKLMAIQPGIIDKAEAQDARELFKCYVTCREIHLQIAAIHTLSALATQPFMRDWNIRSLAKEGDRITIQIFRILTSTWYNNLIICVNLLSMFISFFEAPAGSLVDFHLTRSSSLVAVEFSILMVYFVDFRSIRFLKGGKLKDDLSDLLYILLILLSAFDVIIALIRQQICNPVDDCAWNNIGNIDISGMGLDFSRYIRFTRPLRSLFLIRRVKFVQDYLKKIFIFGLSGVLPVVIVMSAFTFVLVLFAHLNLSDCEYLNDESALNFLSLRSSFSALFILMTGEPDIAAETYGNCREIRHKISANIIFPVFTIAVIFFMGLFFAEIRQAYETARLHQKWSEACAEAINLTAAFLMLDLNHDLRLDKTEWKEFVGMIVPSWERSKFVDMVDWKFHEADNNGDGRIQHREFVRLCDFLRVAIRGDDDIARNLRGDGSMLSRLARLITPRIFQRKREDMEKGERIKFVLADCIIALGNTFLLAALSTRLHFSDSLAKDPFNPPSGKDTWSVLFLLIDDIMGGLSFIWSIIRLSRSMSPISHIDVLITFLSGPTGWIFASLKWVRLSMNLRLIRSIRSIYVWYDLSWTIQRGKINEQSHRLIERDHPLIKTKNQLLEEQTRRIRDEREALGLAFDLIWENCGDTAPIQISRNLLLEEDRIKRATLISEQIQRVIGRHEFNILLDLDENWKKLSTLAVDDLRVSLARRIKPNWNHRAKVEWVDGMQALSERYRRDQFPVWLSVHYFNVFAHYASNILNFQVLFRCIGALKQVVNHMVTLFIVIVYPYAIIGMELFAYRLVKCSDADGEKMEWQLCDDYGGHAFNFNSFKAAVLTLYNVFYTGELQDVLVGTQLINERIASIYWCSYYLFVTSILGDVLVSNIIEQLSVRKQKAQEENREKIKKKKYRFKESTSLNMSRMDRNTKPDEMRSYFFNDSGRRAKIPTATMDEVIEENNSSEGVTKQEEEKKIEVAHKLEASNLELDEVILGTNVLSEGVSRPQNKRRVSKSWEDWAYSPERTTSERKFLQKSQSLYHDL